MTILFSVLGVILLGILIYIFVPKDKSVDSIYIPGKYISSLTLGNKNIDVEVTVNNNEILSVKLLNLDEQQQVFYPLVEPAMTDISKQIIDKQSLDIDISSDSSETEIMILETVKQALDKALVKSDDI